MSGSTSGFVANLFIGVGYGKYLPIFASILIIIGYLKTQENGDNSDSRNYSSKVSISFAFSSIHKLHLSLKLLATRDECALVV